MNIEELIGPHPLPPHPCGIHFTAMEQETAYNIPHRVLSNNDAQPDQFAAAMCQWLITHHVSPENMERDRIQREALERQGFPDPKQRFPSNESTQKGNWAEILLAEYLVASASTQLPVYRLRCNTNPDQSMKGDDVLVFDLNSNPVKVMVGEAKFRKTSAKAVVDELVSNLEKSHSGGTPASLQFVADRLFDTQQNILGERVMHCNILFAQGNLQLNYVGFLVSDAKAHARVKEHATSTLSNLAIMSLALNNPEEVVAASYAQLGGLK